MLTMYSYIDLYTINELLNASIIDVVQRCMVYEDPLKLRLCLLRIITLVLMIALNHTPETTKIN